MNKIIPVVFSVMSANEKTRLKKYEIFIADQKPKKKWVLIRG
jgi:hypothetical protein